LENGKKEDFLKIWKLRNIMNVSGYKIYSSDLEGVVYEVEFEEFKRD
jgi:hypothetical protein